MKIKNIWNHHLDSNFVGAKALPNPHLSHSVVHCCSNERFRDSPVVSGRPRGLPSRKLTYPTWGKGKSSSNMPFLGDMLVPWRVNRYPSNIHTPMWQFPPDSSWNNVPKPRLFSRELDPIFFLTKFSWRSKGCLNKLNPTTYLYIIWNNRNPIKRGAKGVKLRLFWTWIKYNCFVPKVSAPW